MDIYSLAAVEKKFCIIFFFSWVILNIQNFLSLNLLWQGPQREGDERKSDRDLEVEGRNSEQRWGGEKDRERESKMLLLGP